MVGQDRVFENNRRKLLERMEEAKIETLLLFSESNMYYASGIRAPTGALILSRNCGSPIVVTSILDYARIEALAPKGFEIYAAYRKSDERVDVPIPSRRVINDSILNAALSLASKCGEPIGADLDFVSYHTGTFLYDRGVSNASKILIESRIIKNDLEIELIEKASSIAEEALRRTLSLVRESVSESELAAALELNMKKLGAWSEAFPTIVAFYSNTAYPHHTPLQEARLSVDGPILVDWGATYKGYRSDETRVFYYGNPTRAFRKHFEILLDAQETALDSVEPGVEAREVDAKAREVLKRAGLEKYFIHGLGHGVGVDIHEEPYLRPGSCRILERGMVITIEPGIYIPGLYGIRIEDTVVVTSRGARRLTRMSKVLLEL